MMFIDYMWGNGRIIALVVIFLTIILAFLSYQYTEKLASEREARVTQILMTPEYRECILDASTCPQVENYQVPNSLGIIIIVLAFFLAAYLYKSDKMQQKILLELRKSDNKTNSKERREIIMSVLKKDEQKVLKAIIEQPSITQSTLRLRTDFSKAKLSSLLKELESRKIIIKEADGKTNRLFMKRNI